MPRRLGVEQNYREGHRDEAGIERPITVLLKTLCGPPASDSASAATGWSPAWPSACPAPTCSGAAGLHLLVHLDGAVDCAGAVAQAAAAGVRVANLDTYRVRDDAIGPGLVLGYGNLTDGQVEEAVALLAAAATEASR